MTVKEKILGLLADCGTMTEAEIRDELQISHGTFFTNKEELMKTGKLQQFRIGRATVYQTTLEERVKLKGSAGDVEEETKKPERGQNAAGTAGDCGSQSQTAMQANSDAAGYSAVAVRGVADGAAVEPQQTGGGHREEPLEPMKMLKATGINEERISKGMETGRITGVFPTVQDWIDEIVAENEGATVETNLDGSQLVVNLADGGQQVYSVGEVPGGVDIEEW